MTKKKRAPQKEKHSNPPASDEPVAAAENFPIVGIGASAGGLAAFEMFFSGMPTNSNPGMAFVLVQHLAPDHTSILTDLIRRYTRMQVFEVTDGMTVQPDCVYIIPPNRDMAFINGTLQLLEPAAPRGQRLPIDFFFRSLAKDQHERAIGVVLSGTGSDGTAGVRAIKGEGGMVVTHDAALAERVRKLRFHGLVVAEAGSAWARDVTGPGHKANMSNLQAVLGLRQLEHLESRYAHRCALVARYRHGLQDVGAFELPAPCQPSQRHAWHLFTILLKPETLRIDRQTLISAMASENIEVGIHYRPLHCLSYLQDRYGFTAQSCPVATDVAGRILSLPLHAAMREADVDTVVAALARVADYYAR